MALPFLVSAFLLGETIDSDQERVNGLIGSEFVGNIADSEWLKVDRDSVNFVWLLTSLRQGEFVDGFEIASRREGLLLEGLSIGQSIED